MNYLVLRKNPADAGLLLMNNNSTQDRDGAFLRFTDLAVPNNARIYGYSILAPDVNVFPAANMVNYANPANFPITTDLPVGGVDPLAVTGLWVTNAIFVVLPDRVDGFHAGLTNDKVQLTWQLGVVDNVNKVIIERSADGAGYSPLLSYSEPAPGQQTAIDGHPLQGENFYRLKLVSNDGTVVAYSAVCAIDVPVPGTVSMNIYPNPVKNKKFNLDSRGLRNETYDLRLFDRDGNLVFSHEFNGASFSGNEVSLPNRLPEGMYAAQVADKNGNKVSIKMIMVE